MTVNAAIAVDRPPSGLTTVTLPAPVAAVGVIDRLTASCTELTRVTELTVIPAFENWTEDDVQVPLVKLNPTTLTVSLRAPRPSEKGSGAMP